MLFNSLPFIFVFLPAVIFGFYLLRRFHLFRFSLTWLALASLLFYAWWSPQYLALLLGSISVNFLIGKRVALSFHKKAWLVAGVIGNLSAIAVYKYLGFFATTVSQLTNTEISVPDLILPLAISFFTFQQIAYLVDTYRSGQPEYEFVRYLLFVSFFPQLIAGPIVQHKEVAGQLSRLAIRSIRVEQINFGVCLFVIGLAKKVILADQLAPYATPVFNAADGGTSPTFLEAWGGLLAYSFQLYFDFSGYADMAVGLAKMFGIELPRNFNSPYKSTNIIEFWRRWHITLSNFLRNYLYIPLGGSREGSRSFNLLATMLLGGFWHGAGWNFIIWGGLHGVYLVANHQWRYLHAKVFATFPSNYVNVSGSGASIQNNTACLDDTENITSQGLSPKRRLLKTISGVTGVIFTFLLVSLAWIFFRAESLNGAVAMLRGVFGLHGLALPSEIYNMAPQLFSTFSDVVPNSNLGSFPHIKGFAVILVAAVLAFLAPNSTEISHWLMTRPDRTVNSRRHLILTTSCMTLLGIVFSICLKILVFAPDSEFLYFNF
ncbi:MBOAT family O-acyltransferase [Microbulbifer harenosus]|uniref:Probable alginate O-acetylase n=1 Tax=Microbulbifer harenosus TaxID=2576840 RepID=A0ABY2UED3_9GAMM|nr:MBOAT family O-acyltransferase [Microbulbifer harenosus]TLM75618.1 MBOAT family protein [Microbulbifer harenosus]